MQYKRINDNFFSTECAKLEVVIWLLKKMPKRFRS